LAGFFYTIRVFSIKSVSALTGPLKSRENCQPSSPRSLALLNEHKRAQQQQQQQHADAEQREDKGTVAQIAEE
jgi:hypothetical protein